MSNKDKLERVKEVAGNLDALADKAGDALWPKLRDSKLTWIGVGFIIASCAYTAYKLIGAFL